MFTTIIIFIIILGVLIFVHEFGHFYAAKKSGMKVEEFGFGFPPRLLGIQVFDDREIKKISTTETVTVSETEIDTSRGEVLVEKITDVIEEEKEVRPKKWHFVWGRANRRGLSPDATIYSINLIPLGGFVKILGENNEHEEDPRSFINRPFWPRFMTLVAGVLMNVVLAWALISIGLSIGLPAVLGSQADLPKNAVVKNSQIVIMEVAKDSPADKAGIKPGDIVLAVDNVLVAKLETVQDYIWSHKGQQFDFKIKRINEVVDSKINSLAAPGKDQGPTGIALSNVGQLKFPWYAAMWEGAKATVNQLQSIVSGLYQLVTAKIGLASLSGPVKIAQLTGQVASLGFVYILQFAAFLSLNLAVLNILPFPALDGGRVLFLVIEKIRGKRNNQKVEQFVNTVGFVLLLLLMFAVTIKDVKGF
jgi:regulator of sigma E protease